MVEELEGVIVSCFIILFSRSNINDNEKWKKFNKQISGRWKLAGTAGITQDDSSIEPATTLVAFSMQNISLEWVEVMIRRTCRLRSKKKSWQSVSEKVWQIIFPLSTGCSGHWEKDTSVACEGQLGVDVRNWKTASLSSQDGNFYFSQETILMDALLISLLSALLLALLSRR